MSQREGLEFDVPIMSDCAPLNGLVAELIEIPDNIHCLRDPTRGGLASTLNEFTHQSVDIGICIDENELPIKAETAAACELLGLDPLQIANEGKLVAVVSENSAQSILDKMKQHKYGQDACIIGEVTKTYPGKVIMKTKIGSSRIVEMLSGELLPRIC
jgi:hydrogenase expression/formation protein HypE